MFLDDREDVGEQAALQGGQILALDGRMDRRADRIDRRAVGVDDPLAGGSPYAAFAVTSLRNLRPSS